MLEKEAIDRPTLRLDRFQPEVQGDGWPVVGSIFDGFRIVRELGHGAFGRVYLATQGDLADRPVALKVSVDAIMESQALAQLQHANIVPIHSLHKSGDFHAVCMPYLGATTLADVLSILQQKVASSGSTAYSKRSRRTREILIKSSEASSGSSALKPLPGARWIERLSHVEGVVKTVRDLAEGLAHAHERGIMHRDLKPANVLLTDDGKPMLLDFNLSHDVKRQTEETGARVGGTVPYMSPEQLRWFYAQAGGVTERADVYSLGVIFYELLTLRLPYRLHSTAEDWLTRMLRDRETLPESPRNWDRQISPAVESMVMHCLEPDPRRRYGSAKELYEDVRRHLQHLPLRFAPDPSRWERSKNWFRRRPKLAAGLAVGIVAVIALSSIGGLYVHRGREMAMQSANRKFRDFMHESDRKICLLSVRTAERERVNEQVDSVGKLIGHYGVFTDPNWMSRDDVLALKVDERQELFQSIGDLVLQLGYAKWLEGQASFDKEFRRVSFERALRYNQQAEVLYHPDAIPKALWMQRKTLAESLGNRSEVEACEKLRKQTKIRSPRERMLVVSDLTAHREFHEALVYLAEGTSAMVANDFWGLFLRGVCHNSRSEFVEAAACFSGCIAQRPDLPEPYVFRAKCFQKLSKFRSALDDLKHAMEHDDFHYDLLVQRAVLLKQTNDTEGALREIDYAVEASNRDPSILRIRSKLRKELGDNFGAMQDLDEAGRVPVRDEDGWLAVGMMAKEVNIDRAIECFNKVLKTNPMSRAALHNKANALMNRNGADPAALEVLNHLVGLFADDQMARKARGLLNARLGNVEAAHADALKCLIGDPQPATYYFVARIYAQTSKVLPKDADEALKHLNRAFAGNHGRGSALNDPDLAPLKADGRLQKAVEDSTKATPTKRPSRSNRSQSGDEPRLPRMTPRYSP